MHSRLAIILFMLSIFYPSMSKSGLPVTKILYHADKSQETSSRPYNFTPTWKSLDSRPLPEWYDKAKIGIKFAWGVFSVPSFHGEWFWYDWKTYKYPDVVSFMRDNYPPNFTYQDFASDFTAQFYNTSEWVDLIEKYGAKYVVFNGKHHEGYTMYPSKYSFGWNSVDVGSGRDLLGELATELRQRRNDIKFGIYHSWYEFYNPLYLLDKKNGFNTSEFVERKTYPELIEAVMSYKPEIIWSDGDWEAEEGYWKSKEFLAWLYNSSPVKNTVVVNDRWGRGTGCKHGGYFNCQDRYNPGVLQPHKWENVLSVDTISWGYRRNALVQDYHTTQELIMQMVMTVSCGGNFLLNIGPTREGMIPPISQERLVQIGMWLRINGDAIYDTIPWTRAQNDYVSPGVWYTYKPRENKLFAILLETNWPKEGQLVLGSVDSKMMKISSVGIYGVLDKGEKLLAWLPCVEGGGCKDGGIIVTLPNIRPNSRNRLQNSKNK
ncbi:Plasma alpha-L-fucosidase [Folsomia candida]|uniref:Putative alpha-L-fucosidase n=1 Tax=Folsomia candida TaxID=158441 RepID=A0A226F5S1_FOLCA|nr:Plasma alpha-L-fucosidase [Folsomia candida]